MYYTVNSVFESLRSIVAADFNGDGNTDLAVADNLDGYIIILMGNGDGTFQTPSIVQMGGAYPSLVLVGDFNNDHIPDLITVDSGGGCACISVLLGNGDGTFQTPVTTVLSIGPTSIAIGDLNGDGKLDVASVGANGVSEMTILLGNGDGTFQTGASYPLDGDLISVAVADFTKKGKLDIAVSIVLGGVGILLGNGDGTFQAPVSYPAEFPGSIQVADFNGDGNPDIAVVDGFCGGYGSCSLGVLLGNGDGTFQPVVNYPSGKGDASVAVGDFNGDHKPDLAVVESLGNAVGVLLNTGVVSFTPTTSLVFPRQLVGTVSTAQTVTLTNSGATALSIKSKSVTGPFQLSTSCGGSVAPAASCDLTVSFQPTAAGAATGLISIRDSASSKPQVIELNGMATVIGISPAQLTFPAQKVGTSSTPQAVTVTNTGSTAVSVSSVAIAGRNYHDYSETNTCGTQIDAGATCKVTVTFTPGAKGTRDALVNVNDNGGGSPQGVLLTGTGT